MREVFGSISETGVEVCPTRGGSRSFGLLVGLRMRGLSIDAQGDYVCKIVSR